MAGKFISIRYLKISLSNKGSNDYNNSNRTTDNIQLINYNHLCYNNTTNASNNTSIFTKDTSEVH